MRYVMILVLLASLPFLHGCAAVALGGAAATGYAVGADRRTLGTITEDQEIEFKIGDRVREAYPQANVSATSYDRMVLLTGQVPDAQAKAQIESIARSIRNVRGVYNELLIGPPSSLSQRTDDAYITSKVKTRFLDAQRFNPLYVKVVTSDGVVYLMGLVTRQEAANATEIARTTSGVKKVVRMFEFID